MRFPLIEDEPFRLEGEFATGQAVTPGQGQTVRVSGVRVGDISKVELEDGRAIITMDLDREVRGPRARRTGPGCCARRRGSRTCSSS